MPTNLIRGDFAEPIHVTKTFLPPIEEYLEQIKEVWKTNQLTNNGPLVQRLEQKLCEYLGVPDGHLLLVANGTLALQLSLRALDLSGGAEIITTPFSYVATTSSILWEASRPIFADIDEKTLCINPDEVEAKITPNTRAILATHVYGRPCDNERLSALAQKHGLRLIYDGAHAFGVKKGGESILNWGDVSTLSFHATKIFQCGEGGAIIAKSPDLIEKLKLIRAFGHRGDEHFCLGTNAKMSELHAAMGLSVLPYVQDLIDARKKIVEFYRSYFSRKAVFLPDLAGPDTQENYSYFPVLYATSRAREEAITQFNLENLFPRRYFYPTLTDLPYVRESGCEVSRSAAARVICMPMAADDADNIMNSLRL